MLRNTLIRGTAASFVQRIISANGSLVLRDYSYLAAYARNCAAAHVTADQKLGEILN